MRPCVLCVYRVLVRDRSAGKVAEGADGGEGVGGVECVRASSRSGLWRMMTARVATTTEDEEDEEEGVSEESN